MPAVMPRGSSLPELLVALVLTGIAGLLGAGLLATTERRLRRAAADDRSAQLARDVAHVLGPEISAAAWPGVLVLGDTALEINAHVGVSVACVVAPSAIVLPPAATASGLPYTVWRQRAEPGDALLARDTSGAWRSADIVAIAERTDGAGCPANGILRTAADSIARRPAHLVTVRGPLPAAVLPGAPVRLTRRVRWVLYRAADRQWWLGVRRCAALCGAPQPVTGPFAAPRDTGLAFRLDASAVVTVAFRSGALDAPRPPLVVRSWSVRGAAAP